MNRVYGWLASRLETRRLADDANLLDLADTPGAGIDRAHGRKLPKSIVLDMNSSLSPTHEPFRLHLQSPAVRVQSFRRV